VSSPARTRPAPGPYRPDNNTGRSRPRGAERREEPFVLSIIDYSRYHVYDITTLAVFLVDHPCFLRLRFSLWKR